MFIAILNATTLLNRIVTTGILITAFALIIYFGLYNRLSHIARGYARLLACLIGTYLGDLLTQISTGDTFIWLRFQWIGIALMPAAALDLSDLLLRATGDVSPTRRWASYAGYGMGTLVFILVAFTDWVAVLGASDEILPHLTPGFLFLPFACYYFACGGWAMYNLVEARRRSLTATTKRRMTYFVVSFAMPMMGIFPYLLPTGWPLYLPTIIPWLGILLVNMAVGAAITFMGYTVAYFRAGAPDRVIKRRLIKFLMRGPLLAALVITSLAFSERIARWLMLPNLVVGVIAAAAIILLMQLFIVTLQPTLDRFTAADDSAEVARLQQFSDRLMTTSDLTQYLENIVAALCDLLRARTAFVMQIYSERPPGHSPMLVTIGDVDLGEMPEAIAAVAQNMRSVIREKLANGHATNGDDRLEANEDHRVEVDQPPPIAILPQDFVRWRGYWLIPLHFSDPQINEPLGVIGLIAHTVALDLSEDERQGVAVLVAQASRAMEDAIKQVRAFNALERIVSDADEMQQRMANTRNLAAPTLADFEIVPEGGQDFTHMVRDALSQFWGGPKLTDSPLLNLQIVNEAMVQNNGNATKALRTVLLEAIERTKPDGTRSMTSTEWLLYNILE
nr:GAF domain-containing protein [Anaerolineae bacterium]